MMTLCCRAESGMEIFGRYLGELCLMVYVDKKFVTGMDFAHILFGSKDGRRLNCGMFRGQL